MVYCGQKSRRCDDGACAQALFTSLPAGLLGRQMLDRGSLTADLWLSAPKKRSEENEVQCSAPIALHKRAPKPTAPPAVSTAGAEPGSNPECNQGALVWYRNGRC